MIFETERLILRPWAESDAQDLYRLARDPAVGPIAGWPPHTSVENSREIIRSVLSRPETYAVVLKAEGRAVGSIGLFSPGTEQVKTQETEWEIGYWIGVPYWGQGLIPEAVRCLQRYAFEELGCTALWCCRYEGNEKSRRVQEKCGFVAHHTEKDKLCPLLGERRDEHYTRLTRAQWLDARCGSGDAAQDV